MKKARKKAQNGESLIPEWFNSPYKGDLKSFSPKVDVKKKEGQSKKIEQQKKVEKILSKQKTIGPTKQFISHHLEKKHEEERLKKLEEYAATHPEVEVSPYGNLTTSSYGEFIQKYGKNLDKFASSWETPMVIQGAGELVYGLGKLGTRYLPQLGEYLTTQTPLRNVYKLNPLAFKPNPEAYYRTLGKEGFEDALSMGSLRARVGGDGKESILGINMSRPSDVPYFAKGEIGNYSGNDIIAETFKPLYKRGDINPITGNQIRGRHWGYRNINEKGLPDNLPIDDVKFYQKDWLKGYKEVPKPKSNSFKSEIDWSKWNPETPSYPELINEYNAIEESTKKAGTWMKNPDGTPFEGLPEQFIQQQSSHFKKAFPEGFTTGYRGAHQHIDDFANRDRNDWATFLTSNLENAKAYADEGAGFYNPSITKPNVWSEGLYELAIPNNANKIQGSASGNSWRLLDTNPKVLLDAESRKRAIYHNEYLKDIVNKGEGKMYGLQGYEPNKQYLSTDIYANYVKNPANRETVAQINDVVDTMGDRVLTPNTVYAVDAQRTPLKSLRHNVGFFDMTNPNIYKGIIPPVAVGAAVSQGSSEKEKLNYGGAIKTDNMKKARKRKAQMGYADKTGKKFIVPKQQEMLEDDIPTIQLSDEEIAATSGKKHVNNLVSDWDNSGYLAERNGFRPNNLSEILASGLMAVNYMLPEERTKWPVVRPQLSYNPYSQGTGSQAIAKNGITISETGYKRNSKDKNKSKLRIPSNMITMEDVDFPVLGTSDNGITKIMYPGENHVFPGANFVDEERVVAQKGAAIRQPIYTSSPNDPRLRAYQDSLKVYNNYEKFRAAMKSKDFTNSDNAEDYYIEVFNKYLKPLWPLTLGKGKRTIEPIFIPAGNIKPANSNKRTGFPFYDNYKGVKPVQPVIYQEEPKIDAPKKRQTSYSRDLGMLPMNVAEPNLSQALYDSSKPTNWSFTYPTGQYNDQKTMYFPDETMWKNFINKQRNVTSQQGNNSGSATGYMEYGGVIPDISKNRKKFKHGGKIEPLTDDVVQFNGPSHADGGIDIEFGNKQVEVEGGETGYLSPIDNSFNVMGNMINPITGKKFKQDSKILAKKEQKVDKLLDYSLDLVQNSNPRDKWDLLKFNSGAAQLQGAYKKKQQIQESKEHLSNIQKAMLDFANENGGDPIEFSKGGIIFPKKKQILGKAQSGDYWRIPASQLDPDKYLAAIFSNEGGKTGVNPPIKGNASGKYALMPATQKDIHKKYFKDMSWNDFKNKYDTDAQFEYKVARTLAEEKIKESGTAAEAFGSWYYPKAIKQKKYDFVPEPGYGNKLTVRQYIDRAIGNYTGNKNEAREDSIYRTEEEQHQLDEAMKTETFDVKKKPGSFGDYEYNPQKVGRSNYNLELTNPDKIQNDSYLRDLSFEQIAPELLVAATNKPEPVFMQEYTPDLYQPYNVSFQDQLNENTATFKPLMKYNAKNPSVQATLAAQKYGADQSVLANEFRTNQGIEADIVNKNIALLNDAELKNLQLADTQYVRQDKARSNTRIQNIGILQSISDKLVQNEAEKRNFQVMKNLFPYYSFDKNYNVNFGGPSAGEMLTPISMDGTTQQNATVIKSNDNKGYKKETTVVKPTVNQQMDQLNLDRRKLQNVQWIADMLRGPRNRFGN